MRLLNRYSGVVAAALFAAATLASAQEAKAKKAAAAPMDEKAAMDAMMKAGAPGDAHKKLEAMTGTWDAKVTSWMAPGKPPIESTGTSEADMLNAAREKARELGADAIVKLDTERVYNPPTAVYDPFYYDPF